MTRRVMVLLAVVAACTLWAPMASAQCGGSQPFGHFGGSFISGCPDDRPVDATVTALGANSTTGASNVVCESAAEVPQGGSCQLNAGVAGDGKVTIAGNWGGNGAVGACPNPNGTFGVGRNVYALRCNDGSGVLVTVGYDEQLGLYRVENAHKADPGDPTGATPLPLQVHPKGVDPDGRATGGQNLRLESLSPGPPMTANVTLRHPEVFSDCDFDSVGTVSATNTCDPVADAGGVLESTGKIFVTTGSCAGIPPAIGVCNGGPKAGQPCTTAISDCGSLTACVNRWQLATTLDPAALPATAPISLPTSACVGGNNPEAPCVTASTCGGRCTGGTRDGLSCTTTAITGTCQGRCTAGTQPVGTQCTSATACGTGGVCTAWPCTLGTCQPVNGPSFNNQCIYLGSNLTFNGIESTAMMTTPITVGAGGPGAASARAIEVSASAGGNGVRIGFRTVAELQLLGFNILTQTKAKGTFQVNDALIRPLGVGGGGFTYTDIVIPRGKFQGGKTVIIESVLTDNVTKLRSDPVQF